MGEIRVKQGANVSLDQLLLQAADSNRVSQNELIPEIITRLNARHTALVTAVKEHELQGLAFDKRPEQAPNAIALFAEPAKISNLVRDQILTSTSQIQFIQRYEFYVRLMQECIDSKNFLAAKAIAAGLIAHPVDRVMQKVGGSTYDTVNAITNDRNGLFYAGGQNTNVRKAQNQFEGPVIQSPELIQSDLNRIYEGNENADEARELEYDQITTFLAGQNSLRNAKPDSNANPGNLDLSNSLSLDDDFSEDRSLAIYHNQKFDFAGKTDISAVYQANEVFIIDKIEQQFKSNQSTLASVEKEKNKPIEKVAWEELESAVNEKLKESKRLLNAAKTIAENSSDPQRRQNAANAIQPLTEQIARLKDEKQFVKAKKVEKRIQQEGPAGAQAPQVQAAAVPLTADEQNILRYLASFKNQYEAVINTKRPSGINDEAKQQQQINVLHSMRLILDEYKAHPNRAIRSLAKRVEASLPETPFALPAREQFVKFTDQDPKIAAQNLMIAHAEMMAKIKPAEFEGKAWSVPDKKHLSPNINRMIDYTNQLSNRVRDDILLAGSKEDQQKMYRFYVNLMSESIKAGDLHGGVAILSGLTNAPISRLKHLTDDPKIKKLYVACEKILTPLGNYKAARAAASKMKGAVIPPLAQLAQDLVFAYDGNLKDFKLTPNGKAMFDQIVNRFADQQLHNLDILHKKELNERIGIHQWFSQTVLNEKQAYDRSLEVAPRGGEPYDPNVNIRKADQVIAQARIAAQTAAAPEPARQRANTLDGVNPTVLPSNGKDKEEIGAAPVLLEPIERPANERPAKADAKGKAHDDDDPDAGFMLAAEEKGKQRKRPPRKVEEPPEQAPVAVAAKPDEQSPSLIDEVHAELVRRGEIPDPAVKESVIDEVYDELVRQGAVNPNEASAPPLPPQSEIPVKFRDQKEHRITLKELSPERKILQDALKAAGFENSPNVREVLRVEKIKGLRDSDYVERKSKFCGIYPKNSKDASDIKNALSAAGIPFEVRQTEKHGAYIKIQSRDLANKPPDFAAELGAKMRTLKEQRIAPPVVPAAAPSSAPPPIPAKPHKHSSERQMLQKALKMAFRHAPYVHDTKDGINCAFHRRDEGSIAALKKALTEANVHFVARETQNHGIQFRIERSQLKDKDPEMLGKLIRQVRHEQQPLNKEAIAPALPPLPALNAEVPKAKAAEQQALDQEAIAAAGLPPLPSKQQALDQEAVDPPLPPLPAYEEEPPLPEIPEERPLPPLPEEEADPPLPPIPVQAAAEPSLADLEAKVVAAKQKEAESERKAAELAQRAADLAQKAKEAQARLAQAEAKLDKPGQREPAPAKPAATSAAANPAGTLSSMLNSAPLQSTFTVGDRGFERRNRAVAQRIAEAGGPKQVKQEAKAAKEEKAPAPTFSAALDMFKNKERQAKEQNREAAVAPPVPPRVGGPGNKK